MAADVFFSYRTREAEHAGPLLEALASVGVSVWRDLTHIRSGDSISDEVRAGIASSRALIVYATENWPRSPLCMAELICAWTSAERLASRDINRDRNHAARRILLLKPHDLDSLDHVRFGPLADCRAFDLPADPAAMIEVARHIQGHLDVLGPITFGDANLPPTASWFPRRGPTSKRFVGRERETWELHGKLTRSRFVAITGSQLRDRTQLRGLGGIGKTLLASHYAHTFEASWPGGIFWLKVDPAWVIGEDTEESLRKCSYAALDGLADSLGVAHATCDMRSTATAVRKAIATRTANKPYLWVIDDIPPATSQLALEALAPPTADGALLITTRYMSFEAAGERVDLSGLDPNAAFALLTSRCRPRTLDERAAAQDLANDVGYHPLALDVLGKLASIASVPQPYAYWRARLAAPEDTAFDRRADALYEELPTGAARSISRVLESSLEALTAHLAVDILRFIALVADTPLPIDFLVGAIGRATADPRGRRRRRARGISRDRIEIALDELASHALVEQNCDSRTVSSHSLVRWAIQRWRPACRMREAALPGPRLCAAARGILLQSFPSLADPEVHNRFAPLLAHAKAVAVDADESSAELCIRLGDYFRMKGDGQSALACEEHAFNNRLKRLGRSHPHTRVAEQRMADTLHLLGRNSEAMEHLRSLESSLLSDPISTDANRQTLLNVRHHTGVALNCSGDLEGAYELLMKVLKERRLILGCSHPHTLVTQHALSKVLLELERPDEAHALLQQTLDVMEKINGTTHHDTIVTRSDLAQVLSRNGEYSRAIELARRSFTDLKAVHGINHRSTLNACNNLAVLLSEHGNHAEARQLLSETLLYKRTHLGHTDPDTCATAFCLARLLRNLEEGEQARALFEEILPAQFGVHGEETHESARTRRELAELALSTTNASTAAVHLAAVHKFEVRTLGRTHPGTLVTASNLAAAYRLAGRPEEALVTLKEALRNTGTTEANGEMAICRYHLAVFLVEDDPAAALEHVTVLERWRDEPERKYSNAGTFVVRNLANLRALCEALISHKR